MDFIHPKENNNIEELRTDSDLKIIEVENDECVTLIDILKLYQNIIKIALLISIIACIFLLIVSYLPWSNNLSNYSNYYNVWTIAIILCISVTSFGPIYITYYAYLIDKSKINKNFLVMVLIQSLFWPILYLSLVGAGIYVWYYYLDFAFFIFGFLPLSMNVAYNIISEKNMTFTIKFGISELFVIISALCYTFFLYPIFMQLSLTMKIVWRLFIHPLWFEITMLLPQRVLTSNELSGYDKTTSFLPALHSLFHNVTIGRMLLYSIDNFYVFLFLVTLNNIQEICLRFSLLWRDKFIAKWIYGDKDNDHHIYGSIISIEMMLELIGIFISPFMMLLFNRYDYMFNFNDKMENMISVTIYSFFVQLLLEIPTDIICIIYEMRVHKIDLINIWKIIMTKKMIIFCIYGVCTMGILGMLYTTVRLPRFAYCSSNLITSCTYSPI